MTFWNVPATLAWIATGHEALCDELDSIESATTVDLCLRLAEYKARGCISNYKPEKETKPSLVKALRSGGVKANAVRNRQGNRVPIHAED